MFHCCDELTVLKLDKLSLTATGLKYYPAGHIMRQRV
jgi:hypothetical protein